MPKWTVQSTNVDIADFSDDPETRRAIWIHRIKVLLIISAILASLFFGGKYGYRWFRERMIDKNFESAAAADRIGDWGTSRDMARSVLLARPEHFEAFRIWQRALAEMGEARAYMAASSIFGHPRSSDQDRLDTLRVMARQAPQAIALGAYLSLPETERNNIQYRAAIAPLFNARGEAAFTEKFLTELPDAARNPTAYLELLHSYCLQGTPEKIEAARNLFAQIIDSQNPKQALDALIFISETEGGLAPGAPLPDLAAWVEKQPGTKTLHHLVALHPQILADPDAAAPIFEKAIQRYIDVDPGTLGTWLIRNNQAERAAEILKIAAEKHPEAYVSRLHSLLRLDRHDELKVALEKPPVSADMVEVEVIKAVIARSIGTPAEEKAAWGRAMTQAAFDHKKNRYIEISRYAETIGATEASTDATVAALRVGWGPLPLYQDLLPFFARLANTDRTEDLLTSYRTFYRFEPHNEELANNFYYLGMLHGILPPDEAIKAFDSLIGQNPGKVELYSSIAFANLINGDPKSTLDNIAKLTSSNRISPNLIHALEGTALMAEEQTEEGAGKLQQVNWKQLFRCEISALRQVAVRLKIRNISIPETPASPVETDPSTIPAWKKAIERMEKDRSIEELPALPQLKMPKITPLHIDK